MMLAACLDAAGQSEELLLETIQGCLEEGLPELKGEFQIRSKRVWRGRGSIAAKYVTVDSIIHKHEAAPVPNKTTETTTKTDTLEATHSAAHSHQHHDHSHDHGHGHSHNHHSDTTDQQSTSAAVNDSSSRTAPLLRNLPQIQALLMAAPSVYIPTWVRDTSIQVFTALAHAEAHVHCAAPDTVHFHEVGAVDSIVDTVGTLLALYLLGATTFSCGRLPMGEGSVATDHGVLPVPAPATLQLMIGMPVSKGPKHGWTGELVTPTGAALLKVLTQGKEMPLMTIQTVGVGAGTKDFPNHPNVLRLLLGERSIVGSSETTS
jgi:uncharacterized protein (DUF111 family)